jgi:hypothetical protein
MIKPIKWPGSLRVDEVITDQLYDELRYGNTEVAMWVNSFGSASAVEEACADFVERNGAHATRHTLDRMYTAHKEKLAHRNRSAQRSERQEASELAWAREIAEAESRQRYALEQSRKDRRKYSGG